MTRLRKECRLNLRFSKQTQMDDMEIVAHNKGMTLPVWAKATLLRALVSSQEDEILARKSRESTLTVQKILERTQSPEDISAARRDVAEYIKRIKDHVG